jgi:hypothetical protein
VENVVSLSVTFLKKCYRPLCWRCAARISALILLVMPSSFSQSSHQVNSRPDVIPAQNLDFSGTHLPPHFSPMSAVEVYDAATRIQAGSQKSDFETTAQYQARLAALLHRPLLHGLNGTDDFAIALLPSARSISGAVRAHDDFLTMDFVETKYDADSQRMSLSIPKNGGEIGSDYMWITAIHRTITYGAPYVGQNAFGVKHLVRKVRTDTLELALDDYDWLAPDYSDDGLNKLFSIAVEPHKARELSETIEILMIGKLHAPFTSHSVEGTEASLEQLIPTDITRVHRLLHMSLDQLIIADSQSGTILAQFGRKKHREEYPLTVEFRGIEVPFSDPRCEQYASLFPFNILSIDYSVDGGTTEHAFLNKPVHVEARQYVDVSTRYCNTPRVSVYVDGHPFKLTCEYQAQYIANDSTCTRITKESAAPPVDPASQ